MTTAQTNEYDHVVENNNLQVGIITDAPAGEDPLVYNYVEELSVGLFVYDIDFPDQVSSLIEIDIRISSFDNEGELRLSLSTIHYGNPLEAELSSINIGKSRLDISRTNISQQVFNYQINDSKSLTFNIQGRYVERLTPYQITPTVAIQFASVTPQNYEVGSVPMDEWQNTLSLLSTETFILPIVALGAAAHILFQSKSTALTTTVNQAKSTVEETKQDVDEFMHDHEDAIDTGRQVKEGGEFATDLYKVDQELGKDHDTNWLTRWAKITLTIYILLLTLVSTRLIYLYPSDIDNLIISVYTGYTAIYMVMLILFFFLSFLRPSVLTQVGKIVPFTHVMFLIIGILIFIVLPLAQLINVVSPTDIGNWSDTLFIGMISMGFVVTSLFAGYYLARSGTSWASIMDAGMSKLRFPRAIRRLAIRLLTVVFFFIVLIRLGRRLALGITILTNSQLATNAYLVSLAASYLKDEATGSIWIVYGLILIFFIQAIMAIFLHLNKENVQYDSQSQPVFVAYRRLALLLLIAVLSFMHLILLLRGKVSELGLNDLVYPQSGINTQDVFNVLFVVPPFKILLDILLAFGLLVTLPFAIREMWSHARKLTDQLDKEGEGLSIPDQSESDPNQISPE